MTTKIFHIQADGSLVCNHRDLTVCPRCAMLSGVHNIHGAHFLMSDAEVVAYEAEVAATLAEFAR